MEGKSSDSSKSMMESRSGSSTEVYKSSHSSRNYKFKKIPEGSYRSTESVGYEQFSNSSGNTFRTKVGYQDAFYDFSLKNTRRYKSVREFRKENELSGNFSDVSKYFSNEDASCSNYSGSTVSAATEVDNVLSDDDTHDRTESDFPMYGYTQEGQVPEQLIQRKIIMSVFWLDGKLGVAAYDSSTMQVQIMNDIQESPPFFHNFEAIFHHLQPTQIVINQQCPTTLMTFIRSKLNTRRDLVGKNFANALCMYSVKYFEYTECRNRIEYMRLLSEPQDLTHPDRLRYLNNFVTFEYTNMVCALGCLLRHLDETHCIDGGRSLPSKNILSITMISTKHTVFIDQETFKALEIFVSCAQASYAVLENEISSDSDEDNNNIRKKFKRSEVTTTGVKNAIKEGECTLFAILNRCVSKMGSCLMKSLLSQPTKDMEELNKRYEVVTFFNDSKYTDVVRRIVGCLKSSRNVYKLLPKLLELDSTLEQWKTFRGIIQNTLYIIELCRKYRNEVALFAEMVSLEGSLRIINEVIDDTIDFPQSIFKHELVVKWGTEDQPNDLEDLRLRLEDTFNYLSEYERNQLPSMLRDAKIIYMKPYGYVLSTTLADNARGNDYLRLRKYTYLLRRNRKVYYKTENCEALDKMLGNTHERIRERERLVMTELITCIRDGTPTIMDMIHKMALLDCLYSFSLVSKRYNLVRPTLVEEPIIHITKGRHLLRELSFVNYVANDFHSSIDESRIKLLSGVHASGKSIYLSQVASIAYLAHIGCFVPADEMITGPLDYIYLRVKEIETDPMFYSSFFNELTQMSYCVDKATASSLILVDEFAKSTYDMDCIAITAGIIRHFISRGRINCPHVIFTTHCCMLVQLLNDSPLVRAQMFEYDEVDDEIKYYYTLHDGYTTHSLAAKMALKMGLGADIVKRSKIIQYKMEKDEPVEPVEDSIRVKLQRKRFGFFWRFIQTKIETEEDTMDLLEECKNLLLKHVNVNENYDDYEEEIGDIDNLWTIFNRLQQRIT